MIIDDQFQKLMDAIHSKQSRLDDRLAEFKAPEEAAAKTIKHSKLADQPYTFKKKGNKAQAKFNSQVENSVKDAICELEGKSRSSKAVEQAKATLQQGIKKHAN